MLEMAKVLTAQPRRAMDAPFCSQGRSECTLRYVELLREARTMLAGFFSILLADRLTPLGEEGNNTYFLPPLSHCPSQSSRDRTGR
jgi:hypothetical protein